MLVLSRKNREDIIITDGVTTITIKVCDIRGEKVRIGIDAPTNFAIHRPESLVKLPAGAALANV